MINVSSSLDSETASNLSKIHIINVYLASLLETQIHRFATDKPATCSEAGNHWFWANLVNIKDGGA